MNRSGLFWGILLVMLGVLFMLSTLGILTVSVWTVFWPFVLVLGGLSLLLTGVQRSKPQSPQPPQRVTMQLKGVETAEIRFRLGGGRLIIDGDTAPDELLDGVFSTGLAHETEELDHDHAILTLRQPSDGRGPSSDGVSWDVGLNALIPLQLDLESGSGEVLADLRDLQIKSLRLRTGASSSTIQLPRSAGHTIVDIEAGAASVMLEIPDGVSARITTHVGAGGIAVNEERFPQQGDQYESPDFQTATNRAEVELRIGAGRVEVR